MAKRPTSGDWEEEDDLEASGAARDFPPAPSTPFDNITEDDILEQIRLRYVPQRTSTGGWRVSSHSITDSQLPYVRRNLRKLRRAAGLTSAELYALWDVDDRGITLATRRWIQKEYGPNTSESEFLDDVVRSVTAAVGEVGDRHPNAKKEFEVYLVRLGEWKEVRRRHSASLPPEEEFDPFKDAKPETTEILSFSHLFRSIRKRAGLNENELADRLEVSYEDIVAIETLEGGSEFYDALDDVAFHAILEALNVRFMDDDYKPDSQLNNWDLRTTVLFSLARLIEDAPATTPAPEAPSEASKAPRPATFGKIVEHYRTAAGMTQTALAKQAGISQPHVSQLESGTWEPRLSTILALAKALGVDPCALLPAEARAPEAPS